MHISVILSTYNSPDLLEKALAGYRRQKYRDFDVLIADDGSGPQTAKIIDCLGTQASFDLQHVWHEDDGFRKCAILNRAIERARGDYLVLSDGDCIPWSDFLSAHARQARQGSFLSGGYLNLPRPLSEAISTDDILAGRTETVSWLRRNGLGPSWRALRLRLASPRSGRLLDALTPTRPSWNGHNASGWKSDLLRVNGFDERMGYGGEDRELGERLVNSGVRPRQIRHRAICLHLWHERSYVCEDVLAHNREIRDQTARNRSTHTTHGIVQGRSAL